MGGEISKKSVNRSKKIGSKFYDDAPIKIPKQDSLGYTALAKAIANSILENRRPEGSVIAINGAWGVGKSSTINLVCHKILESNSDIIIINFNTWCYRSEDGIVAGFFQELYLGLISDKKYRSYINSFESLLKLANRTSSITNAVGQGLNMFLPGTGEAISTGNRYIKRHIYSEEKMESLQQKIGAELESKNARVLIVIDDIDRLSPEEAIAIFRLIKSVGRLKNIIYLLGYDRNETEKMIKKKYKFKGNIYLEKIVQASFDIPEPSYIKISETLRYRLFEIFGDEISRDSERLSSIIKNVIKPEIETLRNVYRLTNVFLTTYPSVEGKVDPLDFIILESLRLFRPNIYKNIRLYKDELTNPEKYIAHHDGLPEEDTIDTILTIAEPNNSVRSRLQISLLELFPRLNRKDLRSAATNARLRNQQNRASSPLHFDTYFQFSISDNAISDEEFEEIIRKSLDGDFVQLKLRSYLTKNISYGETVASYLLDKISYEMDSVDTKGMKSLLVTLHSILEDIRIDFDQNVSNNKPASYKTRILNLSREFLLHLADKEERYEFVTDLFKVSSLDVIMRLCRWIVELEQNESIFSDKEISKIKKTIMDKIKDHINEESMLRQHNFPRIFSDLAYISEKPDGVKNIFHSMLKSDRKNVVLASNQFMQTFDSQELRSYTNEEKLEWMSGYVDIDKFAHQLKVARRHIELSEEDKGRLERLNGIISLRLLSEWNINLSIGDLDSYDFID